MKRLPIPVPPRSKDTFRPAGGDGDSPVLNLTLLARGVTLFRLFVGFFFITALSPLFRIVTATCKIIKKKLIVKTDTTLTLGKHLAKFI